MRQDCTKSAHQTPGPVTRCGGLSLRRTWPVWPFMHMSSQVCALCLKLSIGSDVLLTCSCASPNPHPASIIVFCIPPSPFQTRPIPSPFSIHLELPSCAFSTYSLALLLLHRTHHLAFSLYVPSPLYATTPRKTIPSPDASSHDPNHNGFRRGSLLLQAHLSRGVGKAARGLYPAGSTTDRLRHWVSRVSAGADYRWGHH